jgi:hypothetical protein
MVGKRGEWKVKCEKREKEGKVGKEKVERCAREGKWRQQIKYRVSLERQRRVRRTRLMEGLRSVLLAAANRFGEAGWDENKKRVREGSSRDGSSRLICLGFC